MRVYPRFTLVSTVFNEKRRLEQTIQDLVQQTVQPSEIIITDAGSSDGTYEMLLDWKRNAALPIIVLQEKGCNVAAGRNLAIRAASNPLIVSTDFGCRFDKRWLEHLVAPFAEDPSVKVTGGAFGVLEDDIDTKAAKAAYILSNGYEIDVNASWFIPSSRSIAYYREVYDKVGGYCEWLTLAADDLVYGKQVKAEGYQIKMTDYKGVFWGRHKKAIGYVKEAFRYGLGDGEARVNKRSFLSNLAELLFRYAFFISFLFALVSTITDLLPVFVWVVPFLFILGLRSYANYTKSWLRLKSDKYNFQVFLYGFILLERTRISYIKGFLKGYYRSTPAQKEAALQLNQRLTK